MLKYLALLFLVLFLASCSVIDSKEPVFVAKPLLPIATSDNPIVVEKDILLPIAASKNISVRFFNAGEDTHIAFGSDLRSKDTILCFGLEGENVNMVLRTSPISFVSFQEREFNILLEDKSRSVRGKKFTCTLQLYNSFGDVFQEDFNVMLV